MTTTTQRRVIVALAALISSFILACEQDQNPGTGSDRGGEPGFPAPATPGKKPTPGNTLPPAPGRQPEPPPADPGPYNSMTQAVLKLTWTSGDKERGGTIEYTIGGAGQRIPAPRPKKHNDDMFWGKWERDITVQPGKVIGFTWYPTVPGWAMCTLYWMGQIQDFNINPQGTCAVSFRIPG